MIKGDDKMKKLVTVTGCFMFICIMITSVILPSMPRAEATENNIDADTQSVAQSSEEQSEQENLTFIIKEYEGKVAVFKGQASEPLFISDVSINSLPLTDKEILEKGIEVTSERELNRLIEDYCS